MLNRGTEDRPLPLPLSLLGGGANFPSAPLWIRHWQSVLFVEETGIPGENKRPVANH
jgi:hypothetical protein